MMALKHKEAMQRIEASLKGLQSKGIPCNLQYNNGNSVEGFPKFKDEINSYQGGEVGESIRQLSTKFLEYSNEFYNNPTYQHDFGSWSTFYPDSQKVHHCQMNAFESQFYPLPVENQFQYAPHSTFTPAYPYDFQFQDFQYFVVIDFEATCDKEKNPHPQEIIEFPSVIVSSVTGQLEACFQTYVRPTCNQLLSDFCKDLTGIQQIQVDRGVTLSEALLRHDKWLENKGIKNTNFAVVTWSNWDCRVMLESECRYKKIRKPPYFNRGFKFSITNSLTWPTEASLACNQFPDHMPFIPHHLQKPKDLHAPQFQYHPYCFCGVKSSNGMVRKPGPKQGSVFFGCGNWTVTRGARCHYFEWATQ
ncbi:uncharacterized protein LOC123230343 isoform X2 [Mangifera indica]|uniref:uncharacterized protein LOC123230343 isoform X2 n=1 Tax=Mangifera indica TaxID=29780 RepID=UPI001CFB70D1|nr:uncharacterized protein LOC123230343 isoform X2 [Mangifera indica]